MELENAVETFCSDLLAEETPVDSIVDKETNFGWRVQQKEFEREFENLTKNYGLLCQEIEKMSDEFKMEHNIITKTNEDANGKTTQIENDTADVQGNCEKIRLNIEQLTEKFKSLKSGESTYEDEMKDIKTLIGQQKTLIYKMTNLTWDSRKMEKNILKGYVCHKSGSDVSTFEMPIKAGNNPVVLSDFLWDHVADGVSSDWKEE